MPPLLSVAVWLPAVVVPAFTVSVAVTVLTLRSLFKATAIVESSPVCVIFVVIFASPDTVTVEPSLFVLTSLLSALNFKPLLMSSVFVSVIFVVKSDFVESNSVLEAMSLMVTVFVFAGVLPSCTVKSTLLPVTVYALSAAALFSTNR